MDAGDELAEEEPQRHRHPRARVVRRAQLLAALACRGSIETGAGRPDAEATHRRTRRWLSHMNLWTEADPLETRILRTPLGRLSEHDANQATWLVEGLAVLAWAIEQRPFPRHDRQVDPVETAASVWFLHDRANVLARRATIRGAAAQEACDSFQYAVHCRLRDFLRHREPRDFTSCVEPEWLDALGLDAGPLFCEDDLAIDGRPLRDVQIERIHECAHIAFERQRAIVWLLRGHRVYDQTPVDT